MTNKWFRRSLWTVGVLLLLEIVARFVFGLGELPLYREHHAYEYFYKPNQEVYRFGNRIFTNSYGMRSPEPDKNKKEHCL